MNKRSIYSDGRGLCPLWLVILKSVWPQFDKVLDNILRAGLLLIVCLRGHLLDSVFQGFNFAL